MQSAAKENSFGFMRVKCTLCKHPRKHSNLGLKSKSRAEKENVEHNTGSGQLLKRQQSNIPKRENLSLLLTKSLL